MDINKLLLNHGITKASSSSNDNNTSPPSPITNFTVANGNGGVILSWTNPADANFYGVRIQRKVGSYPMSPTDGTTVFNGVATTFTDTDTTNSETYYYSAFPYNKSLNFNTNASQRVSIEIVSYRIYTVIIDTANSNPSTSVTYADDAVGMTGGSSAWDSVYPFSEIKPVLFKGGAVVGFLNPNNFAQKLDGSAVDIVTGNAGDVMIQFPKFYIYIRKIGDLIYVSLSDSKVNSNYKCIAHIKSGVEKDYLYIAAYTGNVTNNRLHSLSAVDATLITTLSQGRIYAQNNGIGYQLFSYYQFVMIQALYLIKYKNLNSQAAVGNGNTNTNTLIINGYCDSYGMDFGNKDTSTIPMKLFGLENLWGNHYEVIDGIWVDSSYNVYTANENFNDARTGYANHGVAIFNRNIVPSLYVTNVIGTTDLGFLSIEASGGSQSTHFTDVVYLASNSPFLISGLWEGAGGGIFSTDFTQPLSPVTASRLAYL